MQPLQNHWSNNSSGMWSPYSQRFLRTERIPVSICLAASDTKAMETYSWDPAASLTAPGWTKVVVWILPSLRMVFQRNFRRSVVNLSFPTSYLLFFSYLSQTPLEAVCGLLSCTRTSEVMRTAMLAPTLPQMTRTTWLLALSLALVWPWPALPDNAEALFGRQPGQRPFPAGDYGQSFPVLGRKRDGV